MSFSIQLIHLNISLSCRVDFGWRRLKSKDGWTRVEWGVNYPVPFRVYFQTLFSQAPKSLQMVTVAMKLKDACSLEELRQHIKKQRHYFAYKGLSSQSYGFSSHVWMWELDYREGWALKNWCFWIVVLEKTLEGPLDCKGIKSVIPKGNQSWIFIGRTDAEAEAPILWPPDAQRADSLEKALKDWRQDEKRTTEDEMVGWHHQLYGNEFEQALGVGDGQGSLACYNPWDCK